MTTDYRSETGPSPELRAIEEKHKHTPEPLDLTAEELADLYKRQRNDLAEALNQMLRFYELLRLPNKYDYYDLGDITAARAALDKVKP